jgi:hypothetical protein
MKIKLLLSLIALSLVPAQLCAMATTIKTFKNQQGATIILIGHLPLNSLDVTEDSDEYRQFSSVIPPLKKRQLDDFIEHLRYKNNALIVLDPSTIDSKALTHTAADIVIVDNFQRSKDVIQSMPNDIENVLKVYNLDYYDTLLQKCVNMEAAIAQWNNADIKAHFDNMHQSLIPLKEKLCYFSSFPIDKDLDFEAFLDYEDTIKQLITTENELYSFEVLAHIVNSVTQYKHMYVSVADTHIDKFVLDHMGYANILNVADFLKMLGFNEAFTQSSYQLIDEEALVDIASGMKALALDLKSALKKATIA